MKDQDFVMQAETLRSSADSASFNTFHLALKRFRMESVLDGLEPANLRESALMPRLIEMGPGLDGQWDLKRMKAIVAVSSLLTLASNAETVLQPIRAFAYDPASPHRMNALTALSAIDPAAASILQTEKERVAEKYSHDTATQIRGCCDAQ